MRVYVIGGRCKSSKGEWRGSSGEWRSEARPRARGRTLSRRVMCVRYRIKRKGSRSLARFSNGGSYGSRALATGVVVPRGVSTPTPSFFILHFLVVLFLPLALFQRLSLKGAQAYNRSMTDVHTEWPGAFYPPCDYFCFFDRVLFRLPICHARGLESCWRTDRASCELCDVSSLTRIGNFLRFSGRRIVFRNSRTIYTGLGIKNKCGNIKKKSRHFCHFWK